MSKTSQIRKKTSRDGLFRPFSISFINDWAIPTSFANLYWLQLFPFVLDHFAIVLQMTSLTLFLFSILLFLRKKLNI